MSTPIVQAAALRFNYGEGPFSLSLSGFQVARGEAVAIIGASGVGKTTLVHLLAGVLQPIGGQLVLDGVDLVAAPEEERRAKRIGTVGMIFQHFALLDYLSVLDNVLLPYHVSDQLLLDHTARERALELIEEVGIEAHSARKPEKLSQGERQRVALCRALVTRPKMVVADEPTGNLDSATAALAMDLLFEQTRARDAALLVVTHDHSLLGRFDRIVSLEDLLELAS